jgi:membrane-associated phospholipid phosphatase
VIGVIAVRFHYFTDTVAGAAVGVGTVCGLALVLDLIPAVRPSRIPRRSAAA